MEKITRKTLVKNLTNVVNRIDELREKKYEFNTKRAVPGYGDVTYQGTMQHLHLMKD